MLTLRKINKKFGNNQVLDNISFKIGENQVVGLLGPNGAGKTTLMRIIVGYLPLDSGRISRRGRLVRPSSMKHKRRIGYLSENNPLYGYMSVAEYLEFAAKVKKLPVFDEFSKKVIKECGLRSVISQKIETLSKGYRQRVGIACALLGNPEIIILDEPTTGLDPNQIIEIRKLIKKMSQKRIVILSTHILPEAKEVCDRLLIINRGKIVLDKETSKIKNIEKKFVELTA